MKRLELKQIEVEMSYGTVRLLINRYSDDDKLTPELVGIFARQDPAIILDGVRAKLTEEGYPWLDDAMIARALAHRDLILAVPAVRANNEALWAEQDRIAAEEEARRAEEERLAAVAAAEAEVAAKAAEEARFAEWVERAGLVKANG